VHESNRVRIAGQWHRSSFALTPLSHSHALARIHMHSLTLSHTSSVSFSFPRISPWFPCYSSLNQVSPTPADPPLPLPHPIPATNAWTSYLLTKTPVTHVELQVCNVTSAVGSTCWLIRAGPAHGERQAVTLRWSNYSLAGDGGEATWLPIPALSLAPTSSAPEIARRSLRTTLEVGWGTFDHTSSLSWVLLPQSLVVGAAFYRKSTGALIGRSDMFDLRSSSPRGTFTTC
jgi:hypothetical protein